MNKEETILQIIDQIESIVAYTCLGCHENLASFNDHMCHTLSWPLKVWSYFDKSLQDLNLDKGVVSIEEVIDYGSSLCRCNEIDWDTDW